MAPITEIFTLNCALKRPGLRRSAKVQELNARGGFIGGAVARRAQQPALSVIGTTSQSEPIRGGAGA